MRHSYKSMLLGAVATAAVVAGTAGTTYLAVAHEDAGSQVKQVFSAKLPNVPGKSLSAVVVNYEPGASSPKHHHAGSVFAFVLSGEIKSEVSGMSSPKVYKAGESFFEPPGSEHLVSANASTSKPASLLAIFVADDGASLTTFDK